MDKLTKYIAELIGTFSLVFIGCGSAVIAGEYIGFLGISFAFGLVLFSTSLAFKADFLFPNIFDSNPIAYFFC